MTDLEQLQLLAQLVDSREIAANKLEKAYQDNDGEDFQKSRKAILDFQQKISALLEEK